MKIAIPVAGGLLSPHFGHCEAFAFYDVEPETKEIERMRSVTPPAHAPGVLPGWLHSEGVDLIIVGGIGSHAHALLSDTGIRVVIGAPRERPEALVRAYLEATLVTGDNACDH
jgi:predicted Fe-Mo cluster-binding NifX family protein